MYGLVLEGGGTKGSYHIGAYSALVDLGIEIGAIAGTSIGAINGAMFLQGDLDLCRELWENIDYSMIIEMEDNDIDKLYKPKLERDYILYAFATIKDLIREGGLDISPLKITLDNYINEEKIRRSGRDFGLVTFNLSDFKPRELFLEDIPEGELKKYILASAYMPVFKGERLDGSYYIDGAVHDNLPFHMLEKRGYDKLIIVRIYGTGKIKKPSKDTEYIVIKPREDLGYTLDFDRDRISYNMKLGYYDTLKVFKNLLGNKYYIVNELIEEEAFKILLKLGEEDIRRMEDILRLPPRDYRRSLFEGIIPRLADYLELNKDIGYGEIIIELLEKKALNLGIERFKLYDFPELLSLVEGISIELKTEENIGILGKLIEKVDKIPLMNKEESLLEISNIIFK